jgi:ribonuclease R
MVNYQIGVHIADVSFYVRPGTKIDEDAYKRGTSVYLVDRVLPMLPEELCNDKCSLRPGEDKLCMSVIFTMDADARVLKYKICRTVIRSDARLNYDEAQDVIMANQTGETLSRENRNGGNTGEKASLKQALATLNTLAQKLRAERIANGALTIEQDEMRFRLDKNGFPTEIYFEQPNEAHHLIEEFMLLANRTVAKAVGSGRPFVYRVHDLPDGEKLENAKQFQKRFPQLRNAYDLLTIRAQAKAVYSTYNIGHYGLAFTHYTHFTSPIRRYPDLMVHRLVDKYILTGKKETMTREQMEEMCEHCSACEQDAAQAERDSIKMFQAMWITSHVGEILPGHISGVTDFGLFVQLDESRCEGLVHITKIGAQGEYWQYDEKNYRLVCEHGKKAYTLGDPVRVEVARANLDKKQLDFALV